MQTFEIKCLCMKLFHITRSIKRTNINATSSNLSWAPMNLFPLCLLSRGINWCGFSHVMWQQALQYHPARHSWRQMYVGPAKEKLAWQCHRMDRMMTMQQLMEDDNTFSFFIPKPPPPPPWLSQPCDWGREISSVTHLHYRAFEHQNHLV